MSKYIESHGDSDVPIRPSSGGAAVHTMRSFYDINRDRIFTFFIPDDPSAEPDKESFTFVPLRSRASRGMADNETPTEFIAFDSNRPLILATSHRPDDYDTIGRLEENAYGNRYHRICLHLVLATKKAIENSEDRPVSTFFIPEAKQFSLAALRSRLTSNEAEDQDTETQLQPTIVTPSSEVA